MRQTSHKTTVDEGAENAMTGNDAAKKMLAPETGAKGPNLLPFVFDHMKRRREAIAWRTKKNQ